ncbi:MAG: S49 family peptidase [Gammaproteobacteria bacterium]
MLASEEIHREIALLKAAHKPIVVSMGDLAASGGYYISAPADEIWASPATITGSIGIFAVVPTGDKTLARSASRSMVWARRRSRGSSGSTGLSGSM